MPKAPKLGFDVRIPVVKKTTFFDVRFIDLTPKRNFGVRFRFGVRSLFLMILALDYKSFWRYILDFDVILKI